METIEERELREAAERYAAARQKVALSAEQKLKQAATALAEHQSKLAREELDAELLKKKQAEAWAAQRKAKEDAELARLRARDAQTRALEMEVQRLTEEKRLADESEKAKAKELARATEQAFQQEQISATLLAAELAKAKVPTPVCPQVGRTFIWKS